MSKANAIGSGSVILTANADGLKSGLTQAAKDVSAFGSKVAKTTGGGGMFGGLANIGKKVGTTFGKGLVLGSGIQIGKSLIGGGPGGGGFGLGGIGDRLQELGRSGETARVFGITAEAFTGMAGAAKSVGSNQREFIESLATIGKLGSDAANGTAQAATAFQKLGLNAEEFNKLPTDEKFYTIMDSISRVTNETDRMYLAGVALGEDGMKNLLPMIGKTGDEIRAMGAGFARSNEDIAAAQSATLSMRAAQASLGKAFDSVVIAIAPAFEYLSVLIPLAVDTIGSKFSGMGDVITPVLRGASVGAGYLWDGIKAGGGIVTSVFGLTVETIGMTVDVFSESIESILNIADQGFRQVKRLVGQLPDWAKAVSPGLLAIDMLGEDTFSNMRDSVDGLGESFTDAGRKMAETGQGMVDSFGQSAAGAREFFDEFERKRAERLKKLAEQKAKGPAVVAPVSKDLLSGPKLAGALSKGSQEAYKAVVSHQLPGLQKASDEAKRHTDLLRDVRNGIKSLANVVDEKLEFAVI